MRYSKPPLTYDQQLELLLSRGLTVEDKPRALRWLKRIGYYRLSAYYIPFRIMNSDNFRPGTTLDQVVDLYKFDCHLRLLFLQAMDRVEIGVRAVLTYRLAHELGPFGYADAGNFARTYDHHEFMRVLEHEEKRASELFVSHYRSKYTSEKYLPIWMVTELVSFGALSKLSQHLRTGVRKRIAKEFNLVEPVFFSWLHTLTYVRNICAHHNRLWNRELSIKPSLPKEWVVSGIANDRLYCIACMLQHLLRLIAPESHWKDRLADLLAAYPGAELSTMKFPVVWLELEPWKE